MAEEIRVSIVGEDRISDVLDGIRGRLDRLSGSVQTLGHIIAVEFAARVAKAGFDALKSGLKATIGAAMEAQRVQAQLDAVLRSTGNAAGLTRDEIIAMAGSLQRMTTFGDEAILSASNLLLTFTNIKKDVFPAALETVLDMSVALGQDLKSSAIQLGKALQDPVVGVGALRRVGVNFSDEQMKVIRRLVETGRVAEAQKLILQELAAEFGGSARAQAETFAGRIEQLRNRLGDASEAIGMALLPILEQLAGFLQSSVMPVIESGSQLFAALIETIVSGGDLGDVADLFGEFANNLGPLEPVARAIQDALYELSHILPEIRARLQDLGEAVIGFLGPVIEWVQNNIQLKDVLIAIGLLIASVVIPALISMVAAAAPVIAAGAALIAAISLLRQAWENDFMGIRSFVLDSLQRIAGWWKDHGDQVMTTVQNFLGGLRAAWNGFVSAIEDLFSLFRLAFEGKWYEFGAKLREIWDSAWTRIREIGQRVWESIKKFFSDTDWGSIGRAILEGIASGIRNGAQLIVDAAISAARAAFDAAKGFLGIRSPSALFEEIGQSIMRGWALGMARGIGDLAGAAVGAGAIASQIVYNTTYYNLSVHSMRSTESIIRDFELMRAR